MLKYEHKKKYRCAESRNPDKPCVPSPNSEWCKGCEFWKLECRFDCPACAVEVVFKELETCKRIHKGSYMDIEFEYYDVDLVDNLAAQFLGKEK